jgi:hypothetical protein
MKAAKTRATPAKSHKTASRRATTTANTKPTKTKTAKPIETQATSIVTKRHVRSVGRSDDGNAFIPDPGEGPAFTSDVLAESLAEEFLESATSGNEVYEDVANDDVAEDFGGPFVVTRARDEYAQGTDASNPLDAKREPLPRAMSALLDEPESTDDEEEEDDAL